MKSLRLESDPVVFLGTADNAVQDSYCSTETLRMEFIVLSLLGYRAAVGAPFLWQSADALNAFASARLLFEAPGGPLLTGRSDTETMGEYFYRRQHDTKGVSNLVLAPESPFRAEQPGAVPLEWKRQIGPTSRIESRQGSVEKEFKHLFLHDASIGNLQGSIYHVSQYAHGASYSRSGRNKADNFLLEVAGSVFSDHFSRALVEDQFLRNANGLGISLALARTSALYQAANGLAHSGVLFTTPSVANQLANVNGLTVVCRNSVSPMNPYLFVDVLRPLDVRIKGWSKIDELAAFRLVNTVNPFSKFAVIYKQFLCSKMLEWRTKKRNPPYPHVVRYLRRTLLLNNDWSFMESLPPFSERKFDSLFAGVVGGVAGLGLGINPFSMAGATRQVVEFGYKLLDGLSIFEALSIRRALRRYAEEVGLL